MKIKGAPKFNTEWDINKTPATRGELTELTQGLGDRHGSA